MKRCLCCFEEYADVFGVCPFCGNSAGCQKAEGNALNPGVKLKQRYIIGTTAGSGGFGITYRSFDTSLSRTVAVKEYFPHRTAGRGPDGREVTAAGPGRADFERGKSRFLSEARLLSGLGECGQIPRVTDYFEENNTAYIVMELLSGKPLSAFLGEGRPAAPAKFAIYTVYECARAVAALQRRGYIHGDVAPDNIFVCADRDRGAVKLIDFGAARRVSARVTEREVLYKPGFSPPEYCRAGKAGKSSDVYSLAATLYMLLTGVKPLPAEKRKDGERQRPASEYNPSVPEAVSGLIEKSMSVDPDRRPKDADAFLRELRRAAGENLLPDPDSDCPEEIYDGRDVEREEPRLLYDLALRGDVVGTTHPLPERLLPGTLIAGRFSIGIEWRRAGVCAVYAGTDMLLDRDIRIYEYFPEGLCCRDVDGVKVSVTDTIGRFGDGLGEFMRNAQKVCGGPKQSASPGLEYFTDLFEAGGTAYLIAEDSGYTTLAGFCRYLSKRPFYPKGRMKPADLFRALGPAAAALDEAAERGEAFGAITPDSFLVGRDGKAVLRFRASLFYPPVTVEGKRRGFYGKGYSAPEQRQTDVCTPECDVYSFAAVACRLLTGRRPPDARDRAAALIGGGLDPLDGYLRAGKVGDDLAKRLKRAMSVRPGKRGRASDILSFDKRK